MPPPTPLQQYFDDASLFWLSSRRHLAPCSSSILVRRISELRDVFELLPLPNRLLPGWCVSDDDGEERRRWWRGTMTIMERNDNDGQEGQRWWRGTTSMKELMWHGKRGEINSYSSLSSKDEKVVFTLILAYRNHSRERVWIKLAPKHVFLITTHPGCRNTIEDVVETTNNKENK